MSYFVFMGSLLNCANHDTPIASAVLCSAWLLTERHDDRAPIKVCPASTIGTNLTSPLQTQLAVFHERLRMSAKKTKTISHLTPPRAFQVLFFTHCLACLFPGWGSGQIALTVQPVRSLNCSINSHLHIFEDVLRVM